MYEGQVFWVKNSSEQARSTLNTQQRPVDCSHPQEAGFIVTYSAADDRHMAGGQAAKF